MAPTIAERWFPHRRHHLPGGETITSSDPAEHDPTQRLDPVGDRPGAPPHDPASLSHDGRATAHDDRASADDDRATGPGNEPRDRRARDLGVALAGALAGVVLTFVIVALTTGGPDAGTDPAAGDRGAPESAELAERDEQIAELDARIDDLESQLAAAGLDVADRDAELAAQREALDARLEALDARVEELDARRAALDEREAALDEREAALDEEGSADGSGQAPDGEQLPTVDPPEIDLPDLPDLEQIGETAEGFVERLLDAIRDLVGRND